LNEQERGHPQAGRNKITAANTAMGGVSHITFQMSTLMLQTKMMQRSINRMDTIVAPDIRSALGTGA